MQRHAAPHIEYLRERIGEGLRELRVAGGLTQSEVAWSSGISTASLSNYESGKRDLPLPTLLALAQVFDVPAVSLVPELCASSFRVCALQQNSLPVLVDSG